jgi:glycosyltransferase involved in cell wall biosynthesis
MNFMKFLKPQNLKRFIRILFVSYYLFDSRYYHSEIDSRFAKIFPRIHFLLLGSKKGISANPFLTKQRIPSRFFRNQNNTLKTLILYAHRASGINPIIPFDLMYLRIYPTFTNLKVPPLYHYKNKNKLKPANSKSDIFPENVPTTKLFIFPPSTAPGNFTSKCLVNLRILSFGTIYIVDTDRLSRKIDCQIKLVENTSISENFDGELGVIVSSELNEFEWSIDIRIRGSFIIDAAWLREIIYDELLHEHQKDDLTKILERKLLNLLQLVRLRLPREFVCRDFNFTVSTITGSPKCAKNPFEIVQYEILKNQYALESPLKKSKIVLVSHEDSISGAPLYLLQIAKILKRLDHNVEIFILRERYRSGVFAKEGFETTYLEDLKESCSEKLTHEVWSVTELGLKRFGEFLDRVRPFQIWFNSIASAELLTVAQQKGIPSILLINEVQTFSGPDNSPKGRIERQRAIALNLANITVYGSTKSRESVLNESLRDNGRIINSIRMFDDPPSKFSTSDVYQIKCKLGIKPTDKVILSIGTFENRKRTLDIVNGFRGAGVDDLTLILVGSLGSKDRYSQKVLKSAKDFPKIHIFDATPNLTEFYAIADAFVLASDKETFPLVLQEAAYFRIPRISSKFPGYEESVSSNDCYLFGVGNISEISEIIAGIFDGNFESSALVQAAFSRLHMRQEKFQWEIQDLMNSLENWGVSTRVGIRA